MKLLLDTYKYPRSTRAPINGLRHYTIEGKSKPLPSVTTVLGQTQPKEKQESLERWRQKVGREEAKRITREAGDRGTAMHYYLEQLIQGTPTKDLTTRGKEAEPMAKIIAERGLSDVDEVYGIEAVLYYPDLYAGSVDLVARYKGKVSIIDFKQTNKPKQVEWIEDYFLQMAAYGMAHDVIHDTAIEQGIIMMCSKDGYYQQFMIEGEKFRNAKHKFLGRLNEYNGRMGDNSNVMVAESG